MIDKKFEVKVIDIDVDNTKRSFAQTALDSGGEESSDVDDQQ